MKYIILLIFVGVTFSLSSQVLTESTTISITKFWPQQPNGYTYPIAIKVPQTNPPSNGFPACIILHGNGGNANQMIQQFKNDLECHILVAPTGFLNSWNICDENSKAPDLEMINQLIDSLQQYSNVNPNKIRIIGTSNGAALANNVYIENQNSGVDIICGIVSQMSKAQYHNGGFYQPVLLGNPNLTYCGYSEPKTPLKGRKYISICNVNDPTIPYNGGVSNVGLDFYPADSALYYVAQYEGYIGALNTTGSTFGSPQVTAYSYLNNRVVLLKGDAEHGANSTQINYISDYFEDCAAASSTFDLVEKSSVSIYPNPSFSNLSIRREVANPTSLEVYDVLGNRVFSSLLYKERHDYDLSFITEGVYFIKINKEIFKWIKI